ncbi:MAG: hypothetical protein J5505_05895 [Spirochaetaceae bacterium]|nr:hypothetical protein [Spirochaetaceae bacterium]
MTRQILIRTADSWFEFSKSRTGQLDFSGKLENGAKPDVSNYQQIVSSAYFTPSYYVFLADGINKNPEVFVADGVDVSDKDTFEYLVHVGPLLAAIETKDSLLAGELYLRRRSVFEKFAQLTQYIMEDLCVEILFSLCYGRMQNVNPNTIPLIFENAKKKLEFDSSRESLDQAFMRWFKKNAVTLTLPLVGTNFHSWNNDIEPELLLKLADNLNADDLTGAAEKIRSAKHDFYKNLKATVQAEPYNPHDKNAIIVCIENISAKIFGNPGLEKAGHIRALAAEIIREAKPAKMAYNAKLFSLTYQTITVQLTV